MRKVGLFSRKKPVINLDDQAKEIYKQINQITMNAKNELDFDVALSLYELALSKYDDLLAMIDQGANLDKNHFLALKESLKKERDLIKGVNNEN